jgi:UDP-galactopyranose mutase
MEVSTDYVITAFDDFKGQITVKYNELSYQLPIDLPIIDGLYPEGETLDNLIRNRCPVTTIAQEKELNQRRIPNSKTIASLVQKLPPEVNPDFDEESYLTKEERIDICLTVAIQRVLAEMAGSTV